MYVVNNCSVLGLASFYDICPIFEKLSLARHINVKQFKGAMSEFGKSSSFI